MTSLLIFTSTLTSCLGVTDFQDFFVSISFSDFDGNSVGEFTWGVILIYLKEEAKLVHLQSKLL